MVKPGRTCSEPGCPVLQPCAAHPRESVRFHHRRTPKRTYGPQHQALRTQVFQRDGWRCADTSQGARCGSTVRLQLGHRDRLGGDTPANTFAQCRACNLRQAQGEARASAEREGGR